MNPLIQLKTTPPLLITLVLLCLALLPRAQAVVPPPDGGYPGGNTAEGQAALLSLSTGTYEHGGWLVFASSNTEGNFNTAIGAGTLLANTATENTATGAWSAPKQHDRPPKHGQWSVCPFYQYRRQF